MPEVLEGGEGEEGEDLKAAEEVVRMWEEMGIHWALRRMQVRVEVEEAKMVEAEPQREVEVEEEIRLD